MFLKMVTNALIPVDSPAIVAVLELMVFTNRTLIVGRMINKTVAGRLDSSMELLWCIPTTSPMYASARIALHSGTIASNAIGQVCAGIV